MGLFSYFKMSDAVDDVKYAFDAKDTAIAAAKLVGKGVFNVGRFAVVDVIPGVIGQMAKKVDENPNATDEQRENAKELSEKAQNWREEIKQKDREDK